MRRPGGLGGGRHAAGGVRRAPPAGAPAPAPHPAAVHRPELRRHVGGRRPEAQLRDGPLQDCVLCCLGL